jgi:hypothetical protein
MIITARPPKRLPPRKPAKSMTAANPPMIVTAPRARKRKHWADAAGPAADDDPAADARVAAFFAQMIKPMR